MVRQIGGLKAHAIRHIRIAHVGRDQRLSIRRKSADDGCADKARRAGDEDVFQSNAFQDLPAPG
jgi:hypothetical protein